jgi:hypothetical protein
MFLVTGDERLPVFILYISVLGFTNPPCPPVNATRITGACVCVIALRHETTISVSLDFVHRPEFEISD